MSALAALPSASRAATADLADWLRRRPVVLPDLVGMTLDREDVALARDALARPECFEDPEPVARYESAFAAWNGSAHAFSFASGREALRAVLRALGLDSGDEVVVPGYTCVAVPDAVRGAGCVPVYADVELETFGLDAARFEERLGQRTRAVVLQHLYGLVARDAERVLEIARRRGIAVIEDCAQSAGARLHGVKVGNLGDAAIYSTERSKVFTTMQGGLAVTGDGRLASELRELRQRAVLPAAAHTARLLRSVELRFELHKHPARWLLRHFARARLAADPCGAEPTIRTSEPVALASPFACEPVALASPLASLGLLQLAKVDAYNRQRRRTALGWGRWCDRRGYRRPLVVEGSSPVFLRYPVLVEPERKLDLAWAREELGVRAGRWFETPIHPTAEPVPDCPGAVEAAARCINLPCLGIA